jgi:hypothetical protein
MLVHDLIDSFITDVDLDYEDRKTNVLGTYLKHDFMRESLEQTKQMYINRLLAVKAAFSSTDEVDVNDDSIYQDVYC